MTSLSNLPPPPLLPHEEEEELRNLGRGERRRSQSNHGPPIMSQQDDRERHTDEETLSVSDKEPFPDSDLEPDSPIHDVRQGDHGNEPRGSTSNVNPTDDREAAVALLLYCHNTMQHQTQTAKTPTKSEPSGRDTLSGLALLAGAAHEPPLRGGQPEPVAHPAPRKVHVGLPYQDHNYGAPPPPTPPSSPPPFTSYEEQPKHNSCNQFSNNSTHGTGSNYHPNHHHGHGSGVMSSPTIVKNPSAARAASNNTPITHFSAKATTNFHHNAKNNTATAFQSGNAAAPPFSGFDRVEKGGFPSGSHALTKVEKGLLRQQKKRRRKDLETNILDTQEKDRGYQQALAKLNEPSSDWEGGSSTTRCICGFDHDDEYMICCDGCGVWQHVECMGLDKNQIPETYFCELCKPRKLDRSKAKALQIKKKDKLSPLRYSAALDPTTLTFGRQQDGLSKLLEFGSGEVGLSNGLARKHFNRRLFKTKQKQILKGLRGRVPLKGKMKENKGQRGLKPGMASQSAAGPTSVAVGRKAVLKNGKLSAQRKLLAQDAMAKLRSSKLNACSPPFHRPGLLQKKTNDQLTLENEEDDEVDDDDMDGDVDGFESVTDDYEESLINQYTPEVQILTLRGNSAAQETLLKRITNMNSGRQYRVGKCGEAKRLLASADFDPCHPIAEIRGRFMIMDQFAGNKRTSQQHVLFYSPTGRPLSSRAMKNNRDSSDEDAEDDDFEETLCVDSRHCGNDVRAVRRSCHPNAELRHVVQNGLLQLWLVAGPRGVQQDDEISIAFELPPSSGLVCACNKATCKLRVRTKPPHHQHGAQPQQLLNHQQQNRPKKLMLYDRKAAVALRSSSPTQKSNHTSPITPITHKGPTTSPTILSPIKDTKTGDVSSFSKLLPVTPPQKTVVPTAIVKTEKEEPEDDIEVDEEAVTSPTASSVPSSPTKAAGIRKRRTSSLAADVTIKQEVVDENYESAIKVEHAESQDGIHTTTAHNMESPPPGSCKNAEDRGSERKMTREERKIDAIMRAFEKMEQKQKRKQQAAEHKLTPGRETGDKRRLSVANNDCAEEVRAAQSAVPVVGPSSAKKGRRKSGCTPMKRGRARTISGCSEMNNSSKDNSNDCFAQPAKSKRLLMQGWLQEKHNGTSDLSGGDSPTRTATVNDKDGEESVCFVRDCHNFSDPMAHLKRSNSLTASASPLNSSSMASGAGFAKKRWLRQAMFDDGDSTPEFMPNSPIAPNANTSAVDSGLPDDEFSHENYVTTPLKKRRLMRESVDSAVMDSPHLTPETNNSPDDDEAKCVVDVVDMERNEKEVDSDVNAEMEIDAKDGSESQNDGAEMSDPSTTRKGEADSEPKAQVCETIKSEPEQPSGDLEAAGPAIMVIDGEEEPAVVEADEGCKQASPSSAVPSTTADVDDSVAQLNNAEPSDLKPTALKDEGTCDGKVSSHKNEERTIVAVDKEQPHKEHKNKDKRLPKQGSRDPLFKSDRKSSKHSRDPTTKPTKESRGHSKESRDHGGKSSSGKESKSRDAPVSSGGCSASQRSRKDKSTEETPALDTSDPFARALFLKERKQREKEKYGKDSKSKDGKSKKFGDKTKGADRVRESKERSSVDEPVEEMHSQRNAGGVSPNDSRTSELEEDMTHREDSIRIPCQAAVIEPTKVEENPNETNAPDEPKPETAVVTEAELSGSRPETAVVENEESSIADGSTTPTMDEVDEDSPDVKSSSLSEEAPVRLPPAESLKTPKQASDAFNDRKKKVSLSEYLRRQRSDSAPTNNSNSPPPLNSSTKNSINNNNTLVQAPLGGMKLSTISNDVLESIGKITKSSTKHAPASVSSLGRSKSISDPTSGLTQMTSSIRSSLPAAVTAPPMQLLTPSIPGMGTSSLPKAALFPDIPERRAEQGSSHSVPVLDTTRREPLSQRLRREFGLGKEDPPEMPPLPLSVPSLYPPPGSFPTATVQTPNGPQQVFYVPQTSAAYGSIPQKGSRSPVHSSSSSSSQRGYLGGAHKSRNSSGNSNNGSGASYKPGFY